MRCNKKLAIISILLVFLLVASCTPGPVPEAKEIWKKVLNVATLGFLKSGEKGLEGLMRILIFILVFSLLYLATSVVPGLRENRNISITVAAILSIMSVIFIPESVLVGIGAAYSTLVGVVLLSAPIVGGFALFRMIPGETRGGIALRILVLLVLLTVLIAVKYHADKLITGGA